MGTEVAKRAATATANVTRSEARARMATEARNEQLAERLVIVLGTMRGVAVKLGQMLSLVDAGLLPPEQRPAFQRKLASLQDNVPPVPWKQMRPHIERELGCDLTEEFARFERTPAAAASIGQVYRAQLHDGRDVAVKAQYPEIDAAVRADLKNLRLFLGALHHFQPGLDTGALISEIEERLVAELDYELEAANTRAVGEAYRKHPFIRVPEVVRSSRRVIVTEWLAGRPLSDAYDGALDERNRLAEILFRFYGATPYRIQTYSADPHPGNALLLDDGAVGFIDFGLVKTIDVATAEAELASMRAGAEGDADQLFSILGARGFIPGGASASPREVYDAFMLATGWYLVDAEVEITPEVANVAVAAAAPGGAMAAVARNLNLPAEHAMRARAEIQLAAIIGQLRPRINLHVIAREWIYGDQPVTGLGLDERAWELRAHRRSSS